MMEKSDFPRADPRYMVMQPQPHRNGQSLGSWWSEVLLASWKSVGSGIQLTIWWECVSLHFTSRRSLYLCSCELMKRFLKWFSSRHQKQATRSTKTDTSIVEPFKWVHGENDGIGEFFLLRSTPIWPQSATKQTESLQKKQNYNALLCGRKAIKSYSRK